MNNYTFPISLCCLDKPVNNLFKASVLWISSWRRHCQRATVANVSLEMESANINKRPASIITQEFHRAPYINGSFFIIKMYIICLLLTLSTHAWMNELTTPLVHYCPPLIKTPVLYSMSVWLQKGLNNKWTLQTGALLAARTLNYSIMSSTCTVRLSHMWNNQLLLACSIS